MKDVFNHKLTAIKMFNS